MNRPQTSLSLPYDPTIQPAASPVDKFHAPLVNAPNSDASQLAAISEAFAKLEPQVAGVFQHRFEAYVQNSQQQSTADRAQLRLDSMNKLQDAVKSEQINQVQNPWYMAQMEEEIGRVVGNKAAAAAAMEYETTPEIRKSNDVSVVDKFLSDRFATTLQQESGGSVWATGAMTKVFEEAKTHLLHQHVQNRARELPEEREVSVKADIGNLLGQVTGDVRSQAQAGDRTALSTMTTAKGNLQAKLNDLLLTVDPIPANKWVKEAIIDHALSVEDADVAKELIGSLTTKDGKGLILNDQDRTLMRHLYDRVTDLKIHRQMQQESSDRYAEKKQVENVAGSILSGYADAKKAGKDFNFTDALTPDQISKLPLNVQQKLRQDLMSMQAFEQQGKNVKNENALREILKKDASDYTLGRMTPQQEVTFLNLLLASGGHHDAATLVQTKGQLERQTWPEESNPSVLGEVAGSIGRGEMTGQAGIDKLISIATTNRQLSARDFREFSFMLLGRMNRGDVNFDREVLVAGQSAVANQIFDQRVDTLGPSRASELALDTVLKGSVNKAKNEYLFAHEAMTQDPKWVSMSAAEKQTASQGLIDSVAKKYGGYTSAEAEQAAATRVAKEEKDRADAERRAASKKAGPEVITDNDIKAVIDQGDPVLKSVDSSVQQALKSSGLSESEIAPNPNKKPWFGTPRYATQELTDLVAIQQANLGERGKAAVEATGEAGQGYAIAAQAKLKDGRNRAVVAAQAIGKTIQDDNYAGRIQLTANEIAHQGFATPKQKAILHYLWGNMREYALLRQRAGYSIEEIKTLGKDAYLKFPLFGTEADILDNGPAVGKALGLSPQEAGHMMSEQQALLRNLLNP